MKEGVLQAQRIFAIDRNNATQSSYQELYGLEFNANKESFSCNFPAY